MSKDWVKDINEMHTKFGVRDAVKEFDSVMQRTFLRFRLDFLHEELDETEKASQTGIPLDSEEIVDGLIDLCVVAIGTLDALGVDPHKAWDEVHKANMTKEVGIKESRPNPLGLPDLIKPEGWVGPSHEGNHGLLP
jgi:predicted HAD superfamily Cof-like phosphohydrolase